MSAAEKRWLATVGKGVLVTVIGGLLLMWLAPTVAKAPR